MTYLDLLIAYRDAQTAVFLLWCLLIVLSLVIWIEPNWKPKSGNGRGLTSWCTQHGMPSHECRDNHRP